MKQYEVIVEDSSFIGTVELKGGMAFIRWKKAFELVWIPKIRRHNLFGFKWKTKDDYDGGWEWTPVIGHPNPLIVNVNRIQKMVEMKS